MEGLGHGFMSVPDFLQEELPENRPILGPMSCGEIIIVAAPTGHGKTWLALSWTHAMLTGEKFLYFDIDKPAKVMHIDGEMHGRKLQNRLRAFDWSDLNPPAPKTIGCQYTFRSAGLPRLNLADPEHQEAIIKGAEHFDVLVFDNVYSLVHVEGETMSSDRFWAAVMELNMALRDRNKLVIWFDHTNSAGQVFGTKTKEWQVDYVGILARRGMIEPKKLRFGFEWVKHRELQEYPKAIEATMTTDNVMAMADWDWHSIYSTEELAEKVIEAIEEGKTYGEICSRLHISSATIAKIKKQYGVK